MDEEGCVGAGEQRALAHAIEAARVVIEGRSVTGGVQPGKAYAGPVVVARQLERRKARAHPGGGVVGGAARSALLATEYSVGQRRQVEAPEMPVHTGAEVEDVGLVGRGVDEGGGRAGVWLAAGLRCAHVAAIVQRHELG